MDESQLVDLAQRQRGLITLDQARSLGLSERSVRTKVGNGAWRRMRPGVFAIGGVAPSWSQSVLAATLAAGGDVYVSHRTAARLWGLIQRSGKIDLLTSEDRRLMMPGVVAHRSRLIGPSDHTIVHGIATTSIERTIVDLTDAADDRVIGGWIDQGLRDADLQLERLVEMCGRLGGPGRGIPHHVLAALAMRRPGYDPGRSALESRALAALAEAGLPEPERQFEVVRPDGRPAFIDLAYPWAPLAIELDGYEHHGGRQAFEDDRLRANELALLGWPVLRFTWTMTNAYLCRTVSAALTAAA